VKVAFSILNLPAGGWHWVMRVWPADVKASEAFTVYAATAPLPTFADAAAAAWEAYRNLTPAGAAI
jgi:hypothetical protein